jgi:hypothetical protein
MRASGIEGVNTANHLSEIEESGHTVLAVPFEITETLSSRVRELMGYSIHPPFSGHIDSRHPERILHMPNTRESS